MVFELCFEQVLAIVAVVAPMVRRTRKNLDAEIGGSGDKAAHARDSPNPAQNVVTFFAAQLAAIRLAGEHIQPIMNKRCRVIDIVTLLDIGDKRLCKSR